MIITKRQLRQVIREEALNEGIWDSIKSAVGMGQDPAEAGLEVQQIFEKMGEGVNGMLRLAAKGSQMAKYWESYTGGTRPEALMRGSIPSEYYRSSNQGGYGNILNSIGKFQDHFYDSLWNALAGAAPDAHSELDSIFRELARKPSRRSANKLRDVGVKIKDEALSSGDEDSLVEFNKLLKQWAGEQINQTSFDANAWFEEHQGSFGLDESRRITKRQLQRIIREEKQRINEMWGTGGEQMSVLIQFAQAYASLGGAVQAQVNEIINAYVDGGEDVFAEAVYEVNPNAIDLAYSRLAPILRAYSGDLGDEGDMVLDALNAAKEIFAQGDAEVEADARAAGDL